MHSIRTSLYLAHADAPASVTTTRMTLLRVVERIALRSNPSIALRLYKEPFIPFKSVLARTSKAIGSWWQGLEASGFTIGSKISNPCCNPRQKQHHHNPELTFHCIHQLRKPTWKLMARHCIMDACTEPRVMPLVVTSGIWNDKNLSLPIGKVVIC